VLLISAYIHPLNLSLPEERDVPLFVIGEHFSHQQDCTPRQTEICGSVCELLVIRDHGKPVSDNFLISKPLWQPKTIEMNG